MIYIFFNKISLFFFFFYNNSGNFIESTNKTNKTVVHSMLTYISSSFITIPISYGVAKYKEMTKNSFKILFAMFVPEP